MVNTEEIRVNKIVNSSDIVLSDVMLNWTVPKQGRIITLD